MLHAPLLGRVLLRFDADKEEIHEDLSAAVFSAEGSLWVAADEHHSLERFSPVNPRVFGEHQHFAMADLLGGDDPARRWTSRRWTSRTGSCGSWARTARSGRSPRARRW